MHYDLLRLSLCPKDLFPFLVFISNRNFSTPLFSFFFFLAVHCWVSVTLPSALLGQNPMFWFSGQVLLLKHCWVRTKCSCFLDKSFFFLPFWKIRKTSYITNGSDYPHSSRGIGFFDTPFFSDPVLSSSDLVWFWFSSSSSSTFVVFLFRSFPISFFYS